MKKPSDFKLPMPQTPNKSGTTLNIFLIFADINNPTTEQNT